VTNAPAGKIIVEVTGLSPDRLAALRSATPDDPAWHKVLTVHVAQDLAAMADLLPMLGAYRVEGDVLRFEPRFPLEPGMTYRASLRQESGTASPLVTASHTAPARTPSEPASITHVFPSAEVLPENLLRFYVHFSGPMSRGRIYEHIRLLDASGNAIEMPFLEIDEELWSPDMTRLTLFIDPGRIKRGVRPLEEIGPVLEEGDRYTLVIGGKWKDAHGQPLAAEHRKPFRVSGPDREAIDPKQWQIVVPAAASRKPLQVSFGKPLDHALALRLIEVADGSGKYLDGEAALEAHESRWQFTPAGHWQAGRYALRVSSRLEDLAGNRVGRPFELDLFEGVTPRLTNATVRVEFEVK
jgi:hypothetical protein